MDSMKAVLNQIPGETVVQQPCLTTVPKGDGSNLWAMLRRQKAQIGQIELVLSALKRDVARIDRRQYREAKDEPPSFNPPGDTQYPVGLFQ